MKPSKPSEKTGTHLWNAVDAVAFAEEKLEIKTLRDEIVSNGDLSFDDVFKE